MHILFLTDNFPPEVNAPASRTFEHCREWVKMPDCEVTVITCVPNFPHGRAFAGYQNKLYQTEKIHGIRVIRVWSYISKNEGSIKRILDYLSFMIMGFCASFFVRKVDVIVGTSPQFFTVCAAYAVSVAKRCPWIFELRDIWPESIKTVGAMRHSLAITFLEKLELFLYRKATRVVAVTSAFRLALGARGVDVSKVDVITNGVDLTRFSPLQKDHKLVAELNLKDKFVAGYIGTHGMAHGLETILEAAKILGKKQRDLSIHFLLLGDGAEKASLVKKAEALKLDNLTFLDSVSKDEVVKYWSLLDASIVHLKNKPLFETVIPSKIFECMGMGIPILHGVKGESRDIIETTKSGISFEPEDPNSLAAVLERLACDLALQQELSSGCIEGSKRFDRTALADDMYELLYDVAISSD